MRTEGRVLEGGVGGGRWGRGEGGGVGVREVG